MFQHRSNRLDLLAAELAELLSIPIDPPLLEEIVIVPSLGLRRWLTLQIAHRNAACANIAFPFLGDFINSLPLDLLPPIVARERIAPEETVWAIHRILPGLLAQPEFASVKTYLDDSHPLKLFQLSKRIAQLFDQYAVYRPEVVAQWEGASLDHSAKAPKSKHQAPIEVRSAQRNGGVNYGLETDATMDAMWQAELWRALAADDGVRQATTKSAEENVRRATADLPSRLFVFGLTAIPPLYLEVLFQLAKVRPVHLFLLQPSPEYHGDDLTPKQQAKRNIAESPTGNPLLSSMGRSEAQLTELLIDVDERFGGALIDHSEQFTPPGSPTLLRILQSDIFSARNRANSDRATDDTVGSFAVSANDESLVIHSCHSPMREVEVVYDRLLHLFEKDPTLRPRDVVVLTPDIEKYSPLIHAVFEYTEHAGRKIPYSISDRHPRSASVVVDSFLKLLELSTGRCTAEEVFGLISSPLIARRFGFSDDDLTQVRTWIRETHICWGIDEVQRERLGLPATLANTWRFGLDRLLLGYAVRGENARLFNHVLPYDEIEGDGGELLGRFVSAVEAIFTLIWEFGKTQSLGEWMPLLREALDALFQSDDEDDIRDLSFLRRTFSRLETVAADLGADQRIDIRVLRTHLEEVFSTMEQRGGFLTGSVTFAALKPGRGIPARVIFLMGMNDDVFPRNPQPAEFDLMAAWRLGDPSVREDDRYAFLETICAATDCAQLSYVGRSNIHNEEIPPSIVINELLDYIQQACTFPEGVSARKHLVIDHPLQAFSPRYFNGNDRRLFSYSDANAAAATALVHPLRTNESRPFLLNNLPEASATERAITLKQLISFLAEPARFFMKARFRMDLKERDDSLPDIEPLELGGLDKYAIQQDLLTEWIDTGGSNLEVFTARGVTAAGVLGQLQLRSLDRDAAEFQSVVLPRIQDRRGEPIAVDLVLGDFTLSGPIEAIYGANIVHYRSATLKVRDRLRAWIEHLARSAAEPKARFKTILIGKDGIVEWSEIAIAAELLGNLCELYWRGLNEPVPFFPRSGFAYALAEHTGSNPATKGRSAWYGDYKCDNGERHDHHIIELFPNADPLSEESISLARRVWGPMLQHIDREAAV